MSKIDELTPFYNRLAVYEALHGKLHMQHVLDHLKAVPEGFQSTPYHGDYDQFVREAQALAEELMMSVTCSTEGDRKGTYRAVFFLADDDPPLCEFRRIAIRARNYRFFRVSK